MQAYLPDALNSVLALVNSAGQITTSYSYNVFGAATSSAGASDPNPIRYTGLISGPEMPAGLQDNSARDYSPATGRFISADPSGASGSGDNLYQYANNDTADYSDPSGEEVAQLIACGVGAAVNGIGGALDGRKHSFGDYFAGAGLGCLGGLLLTIPGGEEALAALEAGDFGMLGVDGSEDLSLLEDDLAGDGIGEDNLGEGAAEEGADLADAAKCGGASFAASTKVLLASGAAIPISQLRSGEKVLATNVKTGKTQAEPVTAVLVHHDTDRYDLRIKTAHGTAVIDTTSSHLFWDATSHRWTKAAALKYGHNLSGALGVSVTVAGGFVPPDATGWMWDLTVKNDHDFYIDTAASAVLVHNCPTPGEISGYTRHGLNQAISRDGVGVSPSAINDAVRNPINVVEQANGTIRYTGRNATVILNQAGKVVTTWARNSGGWRIVP